MWRRKDDGGYSSFTDDPRRNKMLMWGCFICCAILITIGLLIFFLYPREPTVTEDGVDVQTFSLLPSLMSLVATVYVKVDNPNYVAIHLVSVELNVTHMGVFIGEITQTDENFPAQQTSRQPIDVNFATSNLEAINAMNQELNSTGYVTLLFQGPLRVTYLSYGITRDISITDEVSPSTQG